jgi:hypothetical protein
MSAIESLYQATANENLKGFICAVFTVIPGVCDSARPVVMCSYDLTKTPINPITNPKAI